MIRKERTVVWRRQWLIRLATRIKASMFGRRLLVVKQFPMFCTFEIDSNIFQKVKVQFRRVSTKLTELTNRISIIRSAGNISMH